jgi:hypothetical protein
MATSKGQRRSGAAAFCAGMAVFVVLLASLLVSVSAAAAPASEVGTGWAAEYFNNTDLSGTPVYTENPLQSTNGVNFNWGFGSPNPAVQVDNFSARFTSTQTFNAGTYQFFVGSDDGVRVFIDNVLVFDRFFGRPYTNESFTATLTAGPHTLRVEYFESIDTAQINFSWFQVTGLVTTATPVQIGGPQPTAGPTPTRTPIPPTPLPAIPPGALTGTVIEATVLLTRAAPYFGAPVVGRLRRGQTYQVIGRDEDARWFLLQLSGFQGWVWGYYLFIYGNEFNAPVVSSFITQGNPAAQTGVVLQTNAVMRLRDVPNFAGQQIGRVPWGDILPVLGRSSDGGWLQVQFRGTIGWLAVPYVTILEGDVNALPVTG